MKAITQFLLKVKLRCAMFGICIWQESPHGLTQLNEREAERWQGGGGGQRETEILLRACISPESSLHWPHHSQSIQMALGWTNGSFRMIRTTFPAPLHATLTSSHIPFRRHPGRTWENSFPVFFSCWNKCQSLHSCLWRESNTLPCRMGQPGSHSVTMQSLQGPLATQPPVLSIRRHRTKAEQGTDGNSSCRSLHLPRSYLGIQ